MITCSWRLNVLKCFSTIFLPVPSFSSLFIDTSFYLDFKIYFPKFCLTFLFISNTKRHRRGEDKKCVMHNSLRGDVFALCTGVCILLYTLTHACTHQNLVTLLALRCHKPDSNQVKAYRGHHK